MKKLIARSIITLGVMGAAIGLSTTQANAAPMVFTVVEGVVPEASANTFDADKITASYIEDITFTGNNFTANLVVTFNGYDLAGVPQANQVGTNTPAGEALDSGDYGLYALVTVSGTFSANPDPGDPGQIIFDFDPTSSTANVYIDPDQDGVNPGGDFLILTATTIDPVPSDGNVTTDLAGNVIGGDFTIVYTNATAQGLGLTYWPDFTGLVLRAVSTGDVDETSNISVGGGGGSATGEASINFEGQQAPEPASMTLFGLALLGAGVAARRRRAE